MSDIKQQIMALVNSGQLATAQQRAQQACKDSPEDAELWYVLSAICGHLQDFGAAEDHIRKAIAINPDVAAAHFNLGVALRHNGKPAEALDSFERVVAIDPGFAAAWLQMANLRLEQEDADAAIDHLDRVEKLQPGTWQAMTMAGTARAMLGQNETAMKNLRSSLAMNPAQPEACIQLAKLLEQAADYEQAIGMYHEAARLGYDQADTAIAVGLLHEQRGDTAAARRGYDDALQRRPDSPEALVNLALLDEHEGQFEQALQRLERAVRLTSGDPKVRYNRARLLATMGHYSDATREYAALVDEDPAFRQALINLGNIYLLSGQVRGAVSAYQQACEIEPYDHDACSNLLLAQNYRTDINKEAITSMHRDWALRMGDQIGEVFEHTVGEVPQRPVRVGFLSPDFRQQSVAFFFISVLEHAGHEQTVNVCYSDVARPDAMTSRLKQLADGWHDVHQLDDRQLAQKIFDDGIDILVDLAGHMAGNRLPVFAMKPSPVQVTWLGYPNTTGLPAMDYRFVDAFTDPPGTEDSMVESPLRSSSCFLCYTPPEKAPAVSAAPVERSGHITFGSFNNLAKMNNDVIAAWASVLDRVPGSSLCIKARQYQDEQIKRRHVQWFGEVGIDEERLELIGYAQSLEEHLALYGRIDIALDTFPYNGTTTTFEALWMGVPVVALKGDRHAARVGYSILANLGREELIADSVDDYIDIAAGLAEDVARVIELRASLRGDLAGSILTDAARFTAEFESTLVSLIDREGAGPAE